MAMDGIITLAVPSALCTGREGGAARLVASCVIARDSPNPLQGYSKHLDDSKTAFSCLSNLF